MASVVLPTVRWTSEADAVVDALRDGDELVVVCDSPEDPVVADAPDRATVLVAGEPAGCSGKASALATGMERATDDVVVWTDDDVPREDGWLDRLVGRARETGVATEVPAFVGDGLWRLFEPAVLLFGTTGVAAENYVWGGGVAFDRTAFDEDAFLADLRRTAGDDSLLSEYVDTDAIQADTDNVRQVHVDGSPRAVYHRLVRYAKTVAFFEPRSTVAALVAYLVALVATVAFPAGVATVTTLVGVVAYAWVDVRRSSVLLTFPSLLVTPPLLALGVAAPRFRWGGRTYRWWGKFDVTVER
jgi:hypothetical protein